VIVASDPGTTNAVSWYLDRFVATNPFRSQHLDAAAGDFALHFFAPYRSWGHLGKTEEEFLRTIGPVDRAEPVLNATLYTLPIHREPTPVIQSVPYLATRRAEFPAFYRQVDSFSGITINPFWGGEAMPTRNSRPGVLEYRFDNTAGDAPQFLQFGFEYKNEGQGNTLTALIRFDDEPAKPLFVADTPEGQSYKDIFLTRQAPYKTLRLRVEETCAPLTARYPGGNLETVSFRDFFLEIVPTGLFDSPDIASVREKNLGKLEHNSSNTWRWGLGPQSELDFDLPEDKPLWLEFDFSNVIPGQTVTVAANGQSVATFPDLPADAQESRRIAILGQKGHNTVTIHYSDWNHGKTAFAVSDIRLMALFIRKLRLVAQ